MSYEVPLAHISYQLKLCDCLRRRVQFESKANFKSIKLTKNICTPMFMAGLLTITKIWKQPECTPADEQIKKLWSIYTKKYYSTEKKNEILPFATAWVNLEIITLHEVSQSEKDKYHMISLIYGM